MKKILFVDDEPQILAGLRALLRPKRDRWDMAFAGSGAEALAELGRERYDVIVSDMKMPGMDGATLLRRVQADHPGVVRIVLSGHTEMETALRTVPVAHQFLLKPCDATLLESVIERACRLQELIGDERVRRLAGGLQQLPPLPGIYMKLTQVLADERASIPDIAELVEQDPAICAKLLQLVNSAFLGLGREIGNVQEAIGYIGINLLKNLTLVVQVFNEPQRADSHGLWLHQQQRHALLVGSVARQILAGDRRAAEDAFMAGILHDIGKMVLAQVDRDRFHGIDARARAESRPCHVIELEELGGTHAEIGGYLLGIWGLPYPIVEAVANHHAPDRVPLQALDSVPAVYLANLLVHEQEARLGSHPTPGEPLDEGYVTRLGVVDRIAEWREFAASKIGSSRSESWLGDTEAEAA